MCEEISENIREAIIRENGYTVESIRECEWNEMKSTLESMSWKSMPEIKT